MPHVRSILIGTGAVPVKSGFALGQLSSRSEHQKTEVEAVQDWESEGGASAHVDEEAFAGAVTPKTVKQDQLLTR